MPSSPFSDPANVASYAEAPPRMVPGFRDMQRMAALLIAERAGPDALVLGAGGGLELRLFAEMQPGWRFDGVDPSQPMLDLATQTLGTLTVRATLHHGLIDVAPEGPFDAATCLLTLHFLDRAERARTLAELRRRLQPGAPLIVAHHSFARAEKHKWLARFAAFASDSGFPGIDAQKAIAGIGEQLPFLSPDEDEAMLRDAGFVDIDLFYAAFTFRGWVARNSA
jgi:tRNA (cmo5U34)-methyltransferase